MQPTAEDIRGGQISFGRREKKTQKNNTLCMHARTHARAESHGEMWRLTSGLHTALPAACRLVLSAAQPCTCKRSADPGAGQCADREKTAPATTFAPAPKHAPSPTEVCCTAAVHSTRFLLFSPFSCEICCFFFFSFLNTCRTILTEKRRHFLNKGPDTREALWSNRVERFC